MLDLTEIISVTNEGTVPKLVLTYCSKRIFSDVHVCDLFNKHNIVHRLEMSSHGKQKG